MQGIPLPIKSTLEEKLSFQIHDFEFLSGGCISPAGCVHTNHGRFFIKWNKASAHPHMFSREADGLKLIAETKTVNVPEVILEGNAGNLSFLVLEFLEKSEAQDFLWAELGNTLAALHQHSQLGFGLYFSNYIGSLEQSNHLHSNWIDFFVEERLKKQVSLGVRSGKMGADLERKFELLYQKLPQLLPIPEKPSLLHGDLWSGNVVLANHAPYLVDPAVYFGNREMDIAYSTLFGKFPEVFYQAYQETYPLPLGFQERIDLYNLYPLLVHVNLFGGNYVEEVKKVLQAFV